MSEGGRLQQQIHPPSPLLREQVSRSALLQYLMPVTLQKKLAQHNDSVPTERDAKPLRSLSKHFHHPLILQRRKPTLTFHLHFCQVIDVLRKHAKSWSASVISMRQAHAAIHLQNDLHTQHTGAAMTIVHERCEQLLGRQNEPSSNHTPVKQLQGKHPLRTQAKALQA